MSHQELGYTFNFAVWGYLQNNLNKYCKKISYISLNLVDYDFLFIHISYL